MPTLEGNSRLRSLKLAPQSLQLSRPSGPGASLVTPRPMSAPDGVFAAIKCVSIWQSRAAKARFLMIATEAKFAGYRCVYRDASTLQRQLRVTFSHVSCQPVVRQTLIEASPNSLAL